MADHKQVDDQLAAFLAWNEEQRREGFTIANVMLAQKQFAVALRGVAGRVSALESDSVEVHERLDNHGAAIISLKRRARTSDDDPEMDTGNFDLASIRREVEETRQKRLESERAKADEQVWWKRSIIMWVVGALGVVVTTLLTVLVTLAIASATAQKTGAPPPSPPAVRQ